MSKVTRGNLLRSKSSSSDAVDENLINQTSSKADLRDGLTPSKAISNEKIFAMFNKIDSNQTQLNEKFIALETNIEQQFSAWRIDIDKMLAVHSSDIDAKIDEISLFVESQREEMDRRNRLNDVVVRGIPMLAKENLINLFIAISNAIHYQTHDVRCAIDSIFRLGAKGPILIKFATFMHKSEFFFKYIKHENLKLSDIGFQNSTNRVFINDNLTHKNAIIYKKANNMKKQNLLAGVSIRSGCVAVKLLNETNWIKTNSLQQLDGLTAEN